VVGGGSARRRLRERGRGGATPRHDHDHGHDHDHDHDDSVRWCGRLRTAPLRGGHARHLARTVEIAYGDDDARLGTSLGGDGEGIQWGPSYGTVAPDGTWWILDGAKLRFAQYDASGNYLGAVPIPPAHLVDGRFMQWQYPLALADGTIVTFRLSGADRTVLLLLNGGAFDEVTLDRQVIVKADDGVLLYGMGQSE
jgi:hypothetical protein